MEQATGWIPGANGNFCRIQVRSSLLTNTITGWWYTYPSEKYDFVSWDDEIPNLWKVIKFMFQTTNQINTSGISY